jgi:CHAT domain-containing protein
VAQELVVKFFSHWLRGGMSKAAAPRKAQLSIYEKCADARPVSWGSYMLIGDYR